jgi:threonyl-tRNA synthetase
MKKEEIAHLRHSLAHLLAAAVLKLYPNAQITLGPAIDDGFYYDIDFGEEKIGDSELKGIQKEMRKMIGSWDKFEEQEISVKDAHELFKGNKYKLELIDEIAKKGEQITLYKSGDFVDLCKGGHVESMKSIDPKAFKLDRVAGAYWRGDEKREMLTRIYGLAFHTPEELDEYLKMREMAKERDHRKIGKEMGLFTFSELVGAGLPMFTPKGTAMRNAIINKIKTIQQKYNYQEVWIPHITKPELYKTSGHWDKFGDELFKVKGKESEFVMKPMNCPHHTQIYASAPKSYKDLPVRFMESTTNYRDEQTGELLGLTRVRSLTQDDGHVFCTEDQVEGEIGIITEVMKEFYSALGMWNEDTCWVRLSAMDPNNPDAYLGDTKIWESSEKILGKIAAANKLNYKKVEGEAAFYGPKLDFMFKDAIGREWQLGTIQLDFNMPKRFELEYTDKDGKKKTPVMIHRAVAGTIERFMGVIIEHFAGAFPFWLSPVQVKIIPVAEAHLEIAKKVRGELSNFRVEIDSSNDGFGKKVSKAKKEKVPYFIIIGDKDAEAKKVTLESRDDGQVGQMSVEEIKQRFQKES